jgi:hypothetical protein
LPVRRASLCSQATIIDVAMDVKLAGTRKRRKIRHASECLSGFTQSFRNAKIQLSNSASIPVAVLYGIASSESP